MKREELTLRQDKKDITCTLKTEKKKVLKINPPCSTFAFALCFDLSSFILALVPTSTTLSSTQSSPSESLHIIINSFASL